MMRILLMIILLLVNANAQARYRYHRHRHHEQKAAPIPYPWYHGTTNIVYPFAGGTMVLDTYGGRKKLIAVGSCADPIPVLNLSAFEGD